MKERKTFYISKHLSDKIRTIAFYECIPQSEIVEIAVSKYIKPWEDFILPRLKGKDEISTNYLPRLEGNMTLKEVDKLNDLRKALKSIDTQITAVKDAISALSEAIDENYFAVIANMTLKADVISSQEVTC